MRPSDSMLTGQVPHRDEMIQELLQLGDEDTIRRVVEHMSVAGWLARADERYLRWCEWPGCLHSFDVRTGPKAEIDGHPWVYVRTGSTILLCPDHQDAGHQPQRPDWRPGDTTIRTSCECGARSGDLEPTTHERCQQWWRQHVEQATVPMRDEDCDDCGFPYSGTVCECKREDEEEGWS